MAEKVSWNVPNYIGFLKRLLLFPSTFLWNLLTNGFAYSHTCVHLQIYGKFYCFYKKRGGNFFLGNQKFFVTIGKSKNVLSLFLWLGMTNGQFCQNNRSKWWGENLVIITLFSSFSCRKTASEIWKNFDRIYYASCWWDSNHTKLEPTYNRAWWEGI